MNVEDNFYVIKLYDDTDILIAEKMYNNFDEAKKETEILRKYQGIKVKLFKGTLKEIE